MSKKLGFYMSDTALAIAFDKMDPHKEGEINFDLFAQVLCPRGEWV